MDKKFDLNVQKAKSEMIKLAAEILIDLLKLLRNIQHLSTERNAFHALNATVSTGIIINKAEILHRTGLRIPHHMGDIVLCKAVDDVHAMRARHAVAAAGAVIAQESPVSPRNLTDNFLIIIGDDILCRSDSHIVLDLLQTCHSAEDAIHIITVPQVLQSPLYRSPLDLSHVPNLLNLLGDVVHQAASTKRLHYHASHIHLPEVIGSHDTGLVILIQIVQLGQGHLPFRILVNNLDDIVHLNV